MYFKTLHTVTAQLQDPELIDQKQREEAAFVRRFGRPTNLWDNFQCVGNVIFLIGFCLCVTFGIAAFTMNDEIVFPTIIVVAIVVEIICYILFFVWLYQTCRTSPRQKKLVYLGAVILLIQLIIIIILVVNEDVGASISTTYNWNWILFAGSGVYLILSTALNKCLFRCVTCIREEIQPFMDPPRPNFPPQNPLAEQQRQAATEAEQKRLDDEYWKQRAKALENERLTQEKNYRENMARQEEYQRNYQHQQRLQAEQRAREAAEAMRKNNY